LQRDELRQAHTPYAGLRVAEESSNKAKCRL
jgi:hypothetical protein